MANSDGELEMEVPNLNYDEDLTEDFHGPEGLMDHQYDGEMEEMDDEELYDEEGYYDDYDASDGAVPHIAGDYTHVDDALVSR